MADKDLKRLNRTELLELLLEQTRVREELESRLAQAEEKLAERQLQMEKAGDLAHAVLEINGVMAAAQKAADQYLDNARAMEARTKRRCEELLAQAQEQADRIIREAKDTRKKIIEKKRRNR